ATGANIAANQTFFIANTAQGGNSTSFKPTPTGGAIASITLAGQAPHSVNLFDCVIAGNNANFGQGSSEQSGGGGAGISLDGANAAIVQCTIADNNFGNATQNLQGQGVLTISKIGATTTTIAYSIIADHVNNFRAAAVQAFSGTTINLNRNLFAANSLDVL